MEKEYDQITAKHYSAYRPPLHQLILKIVIDSNEKFDKGIDIGCGAGHSAVALSDYCGRVWGIDPSADMLRSAVHHPKIEYDLFDGKTLNFPDNFFNVVTFAGSFYYAKSQNLLDEVERVCMDNALIAVYDFEILTEDLFTQLRIDRKAEKIDYDHSTNFSGLNCDHIIKRFFVKDKFYFEIAPADLAHLLLSVKANYQRFEQKYNSSDPYKPLTEHLSKLSVNFQLAADIYLTSYIKINRK